MSSVLIQVHPQNKTSRLVPIGLTTNLFYFYVVMLVLLPTGNLFGINVKILAFLPLLCGAFQRMAREDNALNSASWNLFVFCTFFAWALVFLFKQANEPAMAFSQFKDVITTLAGCWMIRLYTSEKEHEFIKLCIYAVAASGLIKVLIITYALISGASVAGIIDVISKQFGVTLMSVDLGDAGGRIGFVSDTLIPICIFALLCLRNRLRINALRASVLLGLLIFSALYTFSRYLWGNTIAAVILGIVVSERDKIHLWYMAAIAAATAYFYQILFALVAFRFSVDLVDGSDSWRVWQIESLNEFFWNAPFFGNGLGSHASMIRSEITPYAYEVQILAILGQVGLVGSSLFLVILFNYYRKSFNFKGNVRYQFAVLALLLLFIGNGFFNPSLLSSASAVNFGLIFVLASFN